MEPQTWVAIVAAAIAAVALFFTGRTANAAKAQTEIQKEQTRLQQDAAQLAIAQTDLQQQAADAAKAQAELQRRVAEDAAQPYVWVDVRADEAQGSAFNLLLGNSGPTFAHNIRVTIDPPLPSDNSSSAKGEAAQRRLREGIKSLGPGHRLVWFIGIGHKIVEEDVPQPHTITIEAEGPHGPVGPLTYDLDLADLRETRDAPEGNLYFVRKAIKEVADKLDGSD